MTLVAPRIINDVSYVLRINDEMHFACQAQYLVKLEDDFGCSAQCKCLRRIQQHEHFVSLAVRAPLWAAHCRVASDCPSPSLPCNA